MGTRRRLCARAAERDLSYVPRAWLLEAAGLDEDPASWRRAASAVLGPEELVELLRMYPDFAVDAVAGYVTDLEGTTVVLSHAARPEVLAVIRLEDGFSASPALVGDALLLRGHRSLYCLAEE